jgi:exodeoxyribonuclease V beta subunit
MANFDPINVPLQGNNIVEASAGTGKTFSIGLLVLRLLIEKKIPLTKILMVTFTNAAVAELAARIRLFITKAIKVAEGGKIKEEDIRTIVEKYGDSDTLEFLKNALTDFDEASIQTIHSFCQEALNNYALDSGLSFGLEVQTDLNDIVLDSIKQFWRREISILPMEVLENLPEISMDVLKGVVDESIKGKIYISPEFEKVSTTELDKIIVELKKKYLEEKEQIKCILQDIASKKIYIKGFNKNWGAALLEHGESFSGYLGLLGTDKAYKIEICEKFFSPERELALKMFASKTSLIHYLITACIKEVDIGLKEYLQKNHLLTYDGILKNMHNAVIEHEVFRNSLRRKFNAVFIDEFQDTDKLQYDIYNQLFGEDKILFYIGDPKQSIYAWRKADLHTYFQAKKNIPEERHYEMDKNYRSTSAYVEAVEEFYGRCKDAFSTGASGLDLRYLPVKAHNGSAVGLKKGSEELKPLQIFNGETKGKIKSKVPKLVYEILNDGYLLDGVNVKNSDIGILVRTNKEAAQIKGLLASAGIHAITIDDKQVFQDSQEAKSLRYVLQAVLDTTEANINKALLNSFTGYDSITVAEIDKEELLDLFRGYRKLWFRSGVYPMVKEYMKGFGVMQHLLETSEANGLRILTDLTQILELLQEAEYRQELKPLGLYEYLGKQIAGELQEGDEYQQRMESDEAAVKIVTIHKAKGLEYPIVIAPFLDLKSNETNFIKTYAYREEGAGGEYKFYCKGLGTNEQKQLAKAQWEQENRRLLYVALTRAKFNCFLFKTSGRGSTNTCLSPFIAEFDSLACLEEPLPLENDQEDKESSNLPKYWGNSLTIPTVKLSDHLYGKLSFSGLSLHGHTPKENNSEIIDDYDQFIFKDIPGGTNLGTMLHYLFENIDFMGNPEHHREELDKLLDKFYPHKKEELADGFQKMVNHVLDAKIEIDGEEIHLRKISNDRKRNEMEFDLKTFEAQLTALNGFDLGDGIEIRCNNQHMAKSGLLNGLIDLFFDYKGKYYILDWKSNYLGDDLSYYEGEDNMREAMNEGNYHLQYLIYSMAAKNYLEQRLEKFDYDRDFGGAIYVYLRGARAGKSSGIYTNKPTLEQVEKLESIFCTQSV